ncbi:MAG: TetR/AcrR family transcriptional regulator [Candidatus Accumulibacter sp.]|nr:MULTISPECIES: TetR/AcrR family transcriptional regulator [unclassified Candidatus Accumulibacter]MQM34131.1 TetR family transcriptional regulator [Candidatus Accumulibacter phosphatis]MBL8369681.1 TetR/AcrR family transcriptional regulator [Accumulibacter sp.]MBN8513331.1 TetR/AcrR family transcriptional regulator [Accumulibacter sp.]MBO3703236.1 TetR/AcrR family transcriptional regulator [Accumulibacter sp.]HRE70654.1 TetR/AcrR family transcriptional regulator [Accumulibacter sp.]
MPTHTAADCSRAEARRTQILDAAENCVREYGFHRASISKISKASGMGAGHIYHYFANKEAIIAAIVAREVERLLTLTAEVQAAENMLEALALRTESGVLLNLDPQAAGLKLEIVAEASRNPAIAAIVRAADGRRSAGLEETLKALRQAHGLADDAATISTIAEVIAAMFEGLMVRAIRNPAANRQLIARRFQALIRAIVLG